MGSFKDFVFLNEMKREVYEIKVDGKVVDKRSKWNAAQRSIESLIREIARKENTYYELSDKESIKGEDGFVKGFRTWKGKNGKTVKFDIEKLKSLNESSGPSKPKKVTVDHWDGSKPVIAYHYEKTSNMKGSGISYSKVLKLYWKIVKKGMNDPKHPNLDGVNDTKELWAEVIELDNKFKPYGEVMNQSVNDLRNELIPKMKVEISYRC